jgi:predicted kinase
LIRVVDEAPPAAGAHPGPRLVVVHGPPGAGKSTLATGLGARLGLPVLDRDRFKDALFDALGWSDRAWSQRVGAASYDLLAVVVGELLAAGVGLVLETNFSPNTPLVSLLRDLCAAPGARPVEVLCTARPDVCWDRFDRRRREGGRHPGHAGFEDRETAIAALVSRPYGPLGLGGAVIEVDTTDTWADPDVVAAAIRRRWGDLRSAP